jgi:hypothetical protein
MCWISEKPAILKIASEDIKVFKIVEKFENNIISVYRGYEYKIGKLYETEIGLTETSSITFIHYGFHSYSDKCKLDPNGTYFKQPAFRIMFKDICLDEFSCRGLSYYKVDCIIPKGSQYYENDRGEIVSDKIILKEIIND